MLSVCTYSSFKENVEMRELVLPEGTSKEEVECIAEIAEDLGMICERSDKVCQIEPINYVFSFVHACSSTSLLVNDFTLHRSHLIPSKSQNQTCQSLKTKKLSKTSTF